MEAPDIDVKGRSGGLLARIHEPNELTMDLYGICLVGLGDREQN